MDFLALFMHSKKPVPIRIEAVTFYYSLHSRRISKGHSLVFYLAKNANILAKTSTKLHLKACASCISTGLSFYFNSTSPRPLGHCIFGPTLLSGYGPTLLS